MPEITAADNCTRGLGGDADLVVETRSDNSPARRHCDPLELQQCALHRDTALIAPEPTVAPDCTMAWDYQRERVRRERLADRAGTTRNTDVTGDAPVCAHTASRDRMLRPKHALLERATRPQAHLAQREGHILPTEER